jgi:parallel beta-helix repeat protein
MTRTAFLSPLRATLQRARPRATFRPRLEALEDRMVLSTLYVSKTGSFNGHPAYTTIQGAINALPGPDPLPTTIMVANGTYVEQVDIGKANIYLTSANPLGAVIQAPATLTGLGAIVHVHAANDFVNGFTINGAGSNVNFGVRIDSGFTLTVANNHVTNIFNTDPNSGVGILVGRAVPADTTTGFSTITANTIDNYTKAGIAVVNPGSVGKVSGNFVTGSGPTAGSVQYGIQVSDGGTGIVNYNTVQGNIFTGDGAAAAGILVQTPGSGFKVDGNTVFNNQEGIYLFDASGGGVTNNVAHDNVLDGIVLSGSQNGPLTGSNQNKVVGNTTNNNAEDGIRIFQGAGNFVSNNKATGNAFFDFEDDTTGSGTAGTANTWSGNMGQFVFPNGLP